MKRGSNINLPSCIVKGISCSFILPRLHSVFSFIRVVFPSSCLFFFVWTILPVAASFLGLLKFCIRYSHGVHVRHHAFLVLGVVRL